MSSNRREVVINQIENVDEDGEPIGPQPSEFTKKALEGWQSFVENDQDIKIGVYRLGGRKEPNCFNFLSVDYTPDELMEKIRDEFGQGEYALKAWGKGKKGLIFNKQLTIEEPRVDPMSKLGDEIKHLVAGQKPDTGNTDMMALMMNMQQANQQMMMQASKDSQNQMNQLLTVMMPLIAQKPEAPPQVDPIALLLQLKQLAPEPTDQMAGFFKGIEMMKEMSGDSAESNQNDVFRDLLRAAKPLVDKVAHEANVARTLPASVAPQATAQPTATASHQDPTPDQVQNQRLQKDIESILGFARANTDPVSVVDMIHVVTEQEQIASLIQFLNRPDWLTMLESRNPEIANYREWFTLLRNELLADTDSDNQTDLENADNSINNPDEDESVTQLDGLPDVSQSEDDGSITSEANTS